MKIVSKFPNFVGQDSMELNAKFTACVVRGFHSNAIILEKTANSDGRYGKIYLKLRSKTCECLIP